MAWEAIGKLVNRKPTMVSESDGRYLIERALREWLGSREVWCESWRAGVAKVRVGSALLQQEVMVKEYDLRQVLKGELGLELKQLKVSQG